MAFQGFVMDAFDLKGRGWVLLIQLIEGEPEPGNHFTCAERTGQVVALDNRGVQTQSCLTGRPILPQVGILVAWDDEPDGRVPSRTPITSLPEEAPCSAAS